MQEIGSIDRITAVIGLRGTGKSTWAVQDACSVQREMGAIVIGHSPGARLPTVLPNGQVPDMSWHDSIRSLERGLQRHPLRMHFLVTGDPEEVIQYGRELALAIRKKSIKDAGHRFKHNRPVPKGVMATPVHIVIDEGTALRESFSAEDKRAWKIFLTGARHEHVSLTWLIQSPTAKNWILMEQSNRIITFRYMHEWGLNAIRAAGIHKDDLQSIRDLPDFQFLEWTFEGSDLKDKRGEST